MHAVQHLDLRYHLKEVLLPYVPESVMEDFLDKCDNNIRHFSEDEIKMGKNLVKLIMNNMAEKNPESDKNNDRIQGLSVDVFELRC